MGNTTDYTWKLKLPISISNYLQKFDVSYGLTLSNEKQSFIKVTYLKCMRHLPVSTNKLNISKGYAPYRINCYYSGKVFYTLTPCPCVVHTD